MKLKAAVIGASGYAGGELIRLLDAHPVFDLVWLGAHTRAGAALGEVHPHLSESDRRLSPTTVENIPPVDAAFLALPHGASYELGHVLAERGAAVFDLGSDYRFDTEARYEDGLRRSPSGRQSPGRVAIRPPGVVRLGRGAEGGPAGLLSHRGAVGGCSTAGGGIDFRPGRGRLPLGRLGSGKIPSGPICCSGRSRKERKPMGLPPIGTGPRSRWAWRWPGFPPRVTFTPHLLPIQRGLLATVTMPAVEPPVDREDLLGVLGKMYEGRPLVEVVDRPPQTRWVAGSSRALVTAFFDSHTGMVIAQAALDNLLKGAAGQAVQAANLVYGLEEATGLDITGWMP